jgi:hypothetical protein
MINSLEKNLRLELSATEEQLKAIEAERFLTWNDPGLAGIKTRLKSLSFVKIDEKNAGDCCTGHPEVRDFETLVLNDHNYKSSGYITLNYNLQHRTQSASFHNALRTIHFRNDVYNISFTGLDTDRNTYIEMPKFEDALERLSGPKGDDPNNLRINYQVRIQGKGNSQSPQALAEALKEFWQQVSDFLTRNEENPVPEKLEAWYFGVKSQFGDMVPTHPQFEKYISQIKARRRGDAEV